ncbi:CLUMA_CG017201, isoform A [Clunio marinus]|uniref:CLUMA_CG017201, isoform A n=1 Tax=Clunio marinus TaxID=568069 RepID=A0A1J1IVG3_9DIPT|nr:CLUMA_CG017201, isoform A [Clunio marinus]
MLIPKYPNFKNQFSAEIVHLENFNSIFVREKDEQIIGRQKILQSAMQSFFSMESNIKNIKEIVIHSYAAIFVGGAWRRCQIMRKLASKVNIFTLDTGKMCNVKSDKLKELPEDFLKEPQGVAECFLADIKAKKEYAHHFPLRTIEEFKKLLMDQKLDVEVLVKKSNLSNNKIPIIIFVKPGNGRTININALLVTKFKAADSTGPGSLGIFEGIDLKDLKESKMKNEEKVSEERFYVKIKYVVDPGEFYATFTEKNLPEHLKENKFSEVVKMHLAYANPVCAKSWAPPSITAFKHTVHCFKNHKICVVGESNECGSLPVILWGFETHHVVTTIQEKFFNITEFLAYQGYIRYLKENQLKNVQSNDEPKRIKSWTQPKTHEVGDKLKGSSTHVDDNGTIFVVDNKSLKEVMNLLESAYSTKSQESKTILLEIGQPVVVKDPITAKYHRGIIESKHELEDIFEVYLVDYGFNECVQRQDIFPVKIASNIPMLARKYRLARIILLNDDKYKKLIGANFIYKKVTNKQLELEVKHVDDDVYECELKILMREGYEIEQNLVTKKLARWREASEQWPKEKKKFEEELDLSNVEKMTKFVEEMQEKKFADEFKMFRLPLSVDVSVEEMREFLIQCNEDSCFHHDRHLISNLTLQYPTTEENLTEFFYKKKKLKPKRRKFHIMHSIHTEQNIKYFDLVANEISEFHFIFIETIDSITFHVFPLIDELKIQMEKMEDELKQIFDKFIKLEQKLKENSSKHESNAVSETIEQFLLNKLLERFHCFCDMTGKLCLIKTLKEFKRGKILNSPSSKDIVKVFLMDEAKIEDIKISSLFKMPLKFLKYPRKTLVCKLADVELSSNGLHHENPRKLLSNLEEGVSQLKATVVSHDMNFYPIVRLISEDVKQLSNHVQFKTKKLSFKSLMSSK